MTARVLKEIAGKDLKGGLAIMSKERLPNGKPVFTAKISETGKVTLTMEDDWVNKAFENSKKAPTKKAGTSPKAKSGPKGGPKKAPTKSPTEQKEPDEVSGTPGNIAQSPSDKPVFVDKPSNPDNPYS